MTVIGDYPGGLLTADPPAPADDPGEWMFTFGGGHYLWTGHRDGPAAPGPHGSGLGLPLRDRYVIIAGTWHQARTKMHGVFGAIWSHQYPPQEATRIIAEHHLRELVI